MKKLNVVLALVTRDNDYQREQAAAAEATARRLGISLRIIYANSDAIAQTKQILAVIRSTGADRPDAFVVEPVGTEMKQVAKNAVATGIGWVLLLRPADDLRDLRAGAPVPVGCVYTDNTEIGRIQGKQFAAMLPAGGTVLYVEGPAGSVSTQRREGLQQTLPPNITADTVRGNWSEESAYQAVGSRLQLQWSQAPPGIIGCQNDDMAMGARRAVESLSANQQRERWQRIPFTGCDGTQASGQSWVRSGRLAATIIYPIRTGLALELLVKAFSSGTQMPEATAVAPTSFPAVEELRAAYT